ncbi:TPA: chaperonin GroEL [Pseudomonas putida]|uniref:chaperonin GroEL n=1 Tax=Pseudomonas TaxID=286 RepID=UPI0004856474|nr:MULTISPECIES: chaperonin GroEL [Pseudomonas]MDD2152933.1 chaperonin GroEL [Pseudomonas putida]RAS28486.1 chaperonin GroEL [Pseudomonas sp. URMO17WK12:I7]SMF17669.1 thermosome subunit [Pseudomonas sp. URMO17WK12:I5]HDS1680323.1 chaperonin GroEL [Pseudomonas putida]
MPHSKILFRSTAREKILSGATQLADAVRVTLGPKSKSVLMQSTWGRPTVCNDGVSIAKRVDLQDPEENLGAQMLRQAAERTAEAVGDGTSTATVLAQAILADGVRNVVAGASAIDLKRGLDKGLVLVQAALLAQSRPVDTTREKAQVATLSAHNDPLIGQLVADALEKVGVEGVVSVEESKTTETVVDIMDGMRFDRGYVSPYFVTDTEKMQVELTDPCVLLCDHKIGALADLLPLLEQVAKSGQPLMVIAEDIDGEALTTLVVNQIRGVLRAVAVKAPGYGDRRKEMLQDIAVLTGATVVSAELGVNLDHLQLSQLGQVHRAVVLRDSTALVGGKGTREAVADRVAQIRAQIASSTSDYDREKLQERLARLAGGVAVIRVGAPSEAEMKARKDALDDALAATRAAIAEGIVPGGGLALLKAVPALLAEELNQEGDTRTGLQILRRALESPARTIAENSAVDAGVVVARMLAETGSIGFDAASNTYVDMYEAGIIDPTKVVRVALENAVSVASILLLTEATMTDIPEKSAPLMQPPIPE